MEIRIKVWNKDTKKMSTGMSLPMLSGYLNAVYPKLGPEEYLLSTGLFDMDGTEIYQDDIIDFAGLKPILIIWRNGGFHSSWFADSEPIHLTQEGMSMFCKILGNVHEHPELLK